MDQENKDQKIESPEIGASQPEPKKEEQKTTGEVQISERERARQEIENKVGQPAPLPLDVKSEEVVEVPEENKEETPEQTDPQEDKQIKEEDETERLKAKIQKRIGKEVAKRKTLEEQLAEKEAEIERLKSSKQEKPETSKDANKEPTNDEIAAALKKAREEGDYAFEVQILDYMAERKAKSERQEAERVYQENTNKVTERQRKWAELVKDYTVFDDNGKEVKDHPLNLNNENSLLYKTANNLYLDKDLRKSRYSIGSEAENLRRAVSDAYIELVNMEKSKPKEKTEVKSAKERQKSALAEPGAAKEEPTETRTQVEPQNDNEKVEDEIARRIKYRREREAAFI